MKNFFSKIFGKENNEEKVPTFKVLDEIYRYLYYENPSFDFKMKGFLIRFTSIDTISPSHLTIRKAKAKSKAVAYRLFMMF